MRETPESLRAAARDARARAPYADGQAYHQELQLASELEDRADHLERATTKAREKRRRDLARIHMAVAKLGMDDETYRDLLQRLTGARSAKALDAAGRAQVLDHLRRVGHAQRPRRRATEYPGTPHNLNREQMLQKIEAQLADLGLPWSYADAIARRQTGSERVAWVRKTDQLRGIIAALHVEQEKRGLLGTLDELLQRRGWTRDDLARRWDLPPRWDRTRAVLRGLVERLGAEAAETAGGERD